MHNERLLLGSKEFDPDFCNYIWEVFEVTSSEYYQIKSSLKLQCLSTCIPRVKTTIPKNILLASQVVRLKNLKYKPTEAMNGGNANATGISSDGLGSSFQ